MSKVLIAGASGYLGGYVVRELKAKGYSVRALTRNQQKIGYLTADIDEIFSGEVTRAKSIEGICGGIDYVISTIGITRQKDGLTYMDVDYQGNINLLEQAKKSKVQKFIYISVLNAHLMMDVKGIQAKERFVEQLKASGLDYSIIRPSGFFSDMREFLEMAKRGRVYLFGSGNDRINPIHGADLAEVCVNAINDDRLELNIGGPEILTFRDIGKMALAAVKKKQRITSVPIWIIQSFLTLMRLMTSVKTYGPLEFMSKVMTMDVVGDSYGTEKLGPFFKREADKMER